MSVFLLILSIIGIVLLCILALILLILALLLFAPFRYRLEAQKAGESFRDATGSARVSFLYPLVVFRVVYEQGEMKQTLRVCGIRIGGRGKDKSAEEEKNEEIEKIEKVEEKDTTLTLVEEPVEKAQTVQVVDSQTVQVVDSQTVQVVDSQTVQVKEAQTEQVRQAQTEPFEETIKEEKKSKFVAIKDKIESAIDTGKAMLVLLKRKKEIVLEYLKKESTKSAGKMLWNNIKWLLLHIAPRKLEGYVRYGSGNPETTGLITAVGGICYPMYGKAFDFYPDFETEVLEGRVYASGRLRLFGILLRAFRIIRDKNFKKVRRETTRVKDRLAATGKEAKQILDESKNENAA